MSNGTNYPSSLIMKAQRSGIHLPSIRPQCGVFSPSDWIPLLINLSYSIPLLVGYSAILFPVQRKCATSSFFRLFRAQTRVTILVIFAELYTRIFRSGIICEEVLDWFWQPSYLLGAIIYYPVVYLPLISTSCGLLLSLNQATAVIIPLQYEKLWKFWHSYLLTFFFVFCALMSCNIYTSPSFVYPMNNATAELNIRVVPRFEYSNSFVTSIFYFVVCVSVISASITTSIALAKVGLKKFREYERRILFFGFFNSFALLSAGCGQSILFVFNILAPSSSFAPIYLNIREPMYIIQVVVPLLAMLVFCSDIRKSLFLNSGNVFFTVVSTSTS